MVQFGDKYSAHVTAKGFSDGVKDDLIVSLVGSNGEEMGVQTFNFVGHINEHVTFDVSI